jgi:hypothetical protein
LAAVAAAVLGQTQRAGPPLGKRLAGDDHQWCLGTVIVLVR